MNLALRIVVVAPDLETADSDDDDARAQAERSRSLRIGLLENGFNLIATLPADVFLAERIAQLQPDMIIVDAESDARDALEHVAVSYTHLSTSRPTSACCWWSRKSSSLTGRT